MDGQLTAITVRNLRKAGEYADGRGLYLKVTPAGTKSWVYRYQRNGKRVKMGLGAIGDLSLKEARAKITEYRRWLKEEGKDPKIKRDAERAENRVNQVWTFDKCADAYITAHTPSWKNKKHGQQWRNTLNLYASPVFGDLPVEEIDTALVMQVIEPIWFTKTETASRVRGRIERILSWAIVRGYRPHPNPALWRGNIDQLLPPRPKVQKTKHHSALPYAEIALFMAELGKHKGLAAQALRFTILTAARTNEVLGASWDEIDTKEKVWTIPGDRMKSGRPHRVPLSDQALAVLETLPRVDGWLFPSAHHGKHLSNMAMLNLLKRAMKRPDLTVHGFRSTFRDWVAEQTNTPRELAEAALAHVLTDKTEAAYQRGDMLEKRAQLMQAWADYANDVSENIIQFSQA